MKISVIYFSNRPGSIDLLGVSYIPVKDDPDFELVVVDGYPGRIDRGKVLPYLDRLGIIPAWYGPPIPKLFPWSRTGFVNAMNSGLLQCSGEWVIFLHDFTVVSPDGFLKWKTYLETCDKKTLTHGSAIYLAAPKADGYNDLYTWLSPQEGTFLEHWCPADFEVGYWAAPISFFDEVNGLDGRGDFQATWCLNSIKKQAFLLDYKLAVNHDLVCQQVDHRIWEPLPGKDTIYKTYGEMADIPQEPVWTSWSANHFWFLEQRRKNLKNRGIVSCE